MPEFNPDEYLAQKAPAASQAMGNNVQPDQTQLNQFDPDKYLNQKINQNADILQNQYGTLPQTALAGAEGVARGVSLSGSDYLETHLGVNPEDIRGRQEANPKASAIGNIIGTGALIAGTGGIAAPAEAALGTGLAARAAAYALEGGVLGGAEASSEYALGDPTLNAQKITALIGMGSIFGGTLGVLSKGIEATPALYRSIRGIPQPLEGATLGAEGAGISAAEAPTATTGITPTNLEEMASRQKFFKETPGANLDNPQKAVIDEAINAVPLEYPINPLQYKALSDPMLADTLKIAREMPGVEGDIIRTEDAIQRKQFIQKTDDIVKSLSPNSELIPDAIQNGKKASEIFSDAIAKDREDFGPKIGELKKTQVDKNHLPGVIDALTNKEMLHGNPDLASIFDTTSGELGKLKPYDTGMPIAKNAYNNLKSAINDINKEPNNLGRLFNIRDNLDNGINLLDKDKSSFQIGNAKAALMDYIQNTIQKENPNQAVRDYFKKYAINEANSSYIEKTLGAKIESNGFKSAANGKPLENITDKIFSNSETVGAAKRILPPEKFNELLANHLAEQKAAFTDKGVFSSAKFGTYLKKNKDALGVAFSDNPKALQNLIHINNMARIIPDAPSINPSGTAKTLVGVVRSMFSKPEKGISSGDLSTKFVENMGEYLRHKFGEASQVNKINDALGKSAEGAQKINSIKGMINKTSDRISSLSRSIFSKENTNLATSIATSGLVNLSSSKYSEITKKIQDLSSPQAMMDHLSNGTEALQAAAPNTTQQLNSTVVQALQFLNSKIPQASNQYVLSNEFKPSPAQIQKFSNYFNIVNNPLAALVQVKNNNLTHETMEALQAVHPQLYNEMKQKVMENLKPEKTKDLDYQSRISLGKFLGLPLDGNMTPQAVQSYQQVLSMPQNNQQPGLKPTLGGMKELNGSERAQTRSQELASAGD